MCVCVYSFKMTDHSQIENICFCFLPVELFNQKEMFDVGFGDVCSLEYNRTNTSDSRAKKRVIIMMTPKNYLKVFLLFFFLISELFRHCDLGVVTFLKRSDFGAQNVTT